MSEHPESTLWPIARAFGVPPRPASLPQRLARNVVAILRSLDMHVLVEAGVITAERWPDFRDNPHEEFLGLGSVREEACWELIKARLSPELQSFVEQSEVA